VAVIVVGAGIAGIACARVLREADVPVRVLDRARVVGGRMASRRLHGRPVDLGAAYFTARDPEFSAVVDRWRAAGLARPWTDELAVLGGPGRRSTSGPLRYAAPGGLRSLVADLADGLDVRLEHPVAAVGPGPTVDGEPADAVVLAMPDPQAVRLVDPGSPAGRELAGRRWQPVISVAAGWSRRQWAPLAAGFVNDHPVLTIVADDGDRRGDGAPVLVAHTTAAVATAYDAEPERAAGPAVAAVRELLDIPEPPLWTHAHRWRFASPAADREPLFHLGEDGVGLAGDGWGRARVETAWRSGTGLGRAVVARLRAD
jgi:renalase